MYSPGRPYIVVAPVVTSWAVAGQRMVFFHMFLQARVTLEAFPIVSPRGRSSKFPWRGTPRSRCCLWRQTRCESQLQRPPRGSKPWTARSQRGALPSAPRPFTKMENCFLWANTFWFKLNAFIHINFRCTLFGGMRQKNSEKQSLRYSTFSLNH